MFTRKHLGDLHCASCDKNIRSPEGRAVDHVNWRKLPAGNRNMDMRLAKFGAGFSKLIPKLEFVNEIQTSGSALNLLDNQRHDF